VAPASRTKAISLKTISKLPPLVGLYSDVMGSGKTTVADELVSAYGFRRVRFAEPLKRMTRALIVAAGIDAQTAERMVDGDLKEAKIIALGGRTPRYLMQTLGTEWGRELVADRLWVNVAMAAARAHRDNGYPVVIDDMRFPNEWTALVGAGGSPVKVVRPGHTSASAGHTSEGQLSDLKPALTLYNDGDINQLLYRGVRTLVSELGLLNSAPAPFASTQRFEEEAAILGFEAARRTQD
jgi:hypothetical protein